MCRRSAQKALGVKRGRQLGLFFGLFAIYILSLLRYIAIKYDDDSSSSNRTLQDVNYTDNEEYNNLIVTQDFGKYARAPSIPPSERYQSSPQQRKYFHPLEYKNIDIKKQTC